MRNFPSRTVPMGTLDLFFEGITKAGTIADQILYVWSARQKLFHQRVRNFQLVGSGRLNARKSMPVEHPEWPTRYPQLSGKPLEYNAGLSGGPGLRVVTREASEFQRFRERFRGISDLEFEPQRSRRGPGARTFAGIVTVPRAEEARFDPELVGERGAGPLQIAAGRQPVGEPFHQQAAGSIADRNIHGAHNGLQVARHE